MIRRRFVLLLFLIGAISLHTLLQRWSFSLIPISISVPFLITWLLPKPSRYLIGWAILAELFTTLPVGILTIVSCLPLLFHWFFSRMKVDLSFSFLLFTTFTILVQVSVLIAYTIMSSNTVFYLPWIMWASTIGLTTLFSYSVCVIDQQLYPQHE